MRLLEIRNNCTFSLTKDLIGDDEIPAYAILSHTWQAGEEVTFDDFENKTGDNKVGWEKILFCAQQAERDNLRHFWVDTCCINKADSAELQEAINSMFRWYRDAVACYVFLSDVTVGKQDCISAWERAFRDSRWFTRGWTLQELLAPRVVSFFSRDGKRLGDRLELKQQIHEITGIPVAALAGAPLDDFSVGEQLSWSKGRRTTRKEDRAYSLLGIFDVSLIPNYGEGEAHAFKRLQEQIDKPLLGLNKQVDQHTWMLNNLKKILQQIQLNRPKELGYPWETSVPEGQLRLDDGLGPAYLLPVDLCETPEDFFGLLNLRYQSQKLPGLPQIQRGHILLLEWNERHEVSRENWSHVVKGDRAMKLSFIMGDSQGPPRNRCMRCYKPRDPYVSRSPFKQCHSCKLAVRWVAPDYLPFEPEDTIIFDRDTYRDYQVRSRRPQAQDHSSVPDGVDAQPVETHDDDIPPSIDLVCHRLTMKWEPNINVVFRYLFCRCVIRLNTPSRLIDEMTILRARACPRHNTQGITFRDYSELALPCHQDPYFDRFGGYNVFWALLQCCLPQIYHLLGGPAAITPQQLEYGHVDLARMDEHDKGAVNRIANDYRSELAEVFPGEDTHQRQEVEENSNSKFSIENETRAERRRQFRESPVGEDLREIEKGNWNGIPHWVIKD